MRLRVNDMVNTSLNPDEAGKKFAQTLLDSHVVWENLAIQMTGIPARIFISAFWDNFKQEILQSAPSLLKDIQNVEWICDHEFQEKNIKDWLN